MPADEDKYFYDLLDSIAATGDEDAVAQNKRIKEAEFAEDSREPNEEETEAIRHELEEERHATHGKESKNNQPREGLAARTESRNGC